VYHTHEKNGAPLPLLENSVIKKYTPAGSYMRFPLSKGGRSIAGQEREEETGLYQAERSAAG
jgi:hypothetical protein